MKPTQRDILNWKEELRCIEHLEEQLQEAEERQQELEKWIAQSEGAGDRYDRDQEFQERMRDG